MKVVRLTGTDYPVTEQSYACAVWLMKKYSSASYVDRCYRLLATFTREYEVFARSGRGQYPNEGYRDTLAHLYEYQARFERGLSLVRVGDKSGYQEIREGTEFADYAFGPRFDHGEIFDEVGFRRKPLPCIDLFLWLDRAADLAVRIDWTMAVEWTFERLLLPDPVPPPPIPSPVPHLVRPRKTEIIGRDAEVPFVGIWQPIDVPKGCPNFLRPGMKGPRVQVPTRRLEDPLLPGEPLLRYPISYHYEPRPTRWQLLWEDTRYRDGVIPDESEYLDPTTEFPDDGIKPAPSLAPHTRGN